LDEQAIFREGLRLLIERQPGLEVVGEAGSRENALEIAGRQQPDIILLDLNIARDSSPKIVSDLLVTARGAHIIILIDARDLQTRHRAACLGAMGLVLKQEASEALIKAIKKVSKGEVWIDRSTTAGFLAELSSTAPHRKTDPEKGRIAALTQREREVIMLIANGLKNKKIAETLFISEATVSHHLTSIFSKLGVTDRLQLLIYAYRHDLVDLGF